MINRDGVGNAARFLNHGFFALLDEDFVDYTDDLASRRIVKRTATVARVGCGVKLEYVVRRGETRDNVFLQ